MFLLGATSEKVLYVGVHKRKIWEVFLKHKIKNNWAGWRLASKGDSRHPLSMRGQGHQTDLQPLQ
jgi:hypothetical protein